MKNLTITHARKPAAASCSCRRWALSAAGTEPADLAALKLAARRHSGPGHETAVSTAETLTYEHRESA